MPDQHVFVSLDDARRKVKSWRQDYNQVRPHSSLGDLTPDQFRRTTTSHSPTSTNLRLVSQTLSISSLSRAEDAVAARITQRPQLARHHGRRYPVPRRGLYSFVYILLVRIQLARPRLTLVLRQRLTSQIAPAHVGRNLEHPHDLADALALTTQDPELHGSLRPTSMGALCSEYPMPGWVNFRIGGRGSVLRRL